MCAAVQSCTMTIPLPTDTHLNWALLGLCASALPVRELQICSRVLENASGCWAQDKRYFYWCFLPISQGTPYAVWVGYEKFQTFMLSVNRQTLCSVRKAKLGLKWYLKDKTVQRSSHQAKQLNFVYLASLFLKWDISIIVHRFKCINIIWLLGKEIAFGRARKWKSAEDYYWYRGRQVFLRTWKRKYSSQRNKRTMYRLLCHWNRAH